MYPFPWLHSHSHSHSRPWELFDYIQIPIYSRKVIPIFSVSHSHWNKKSSKKLIVMHGEEWFSLEWAHKIIHCCSMLVSHSTHDMLGWRSGQCKVKMAVLSQFTYPTEQKLLIRWKKAAMGIHSYSHSSIPIPVRLFPFPRYSRCHSHFHGNPMGPTGFQLFPFPCISLVPSNGTQCSQWRP